MDYLDMKIWFLSHVVALLLLTVHDRRECTEKVNKITMSRGAMMLWA